MSIFNKGFTMNKTIKYKKAIICGDGIKSNNGVIIA